MIDAGQRSARVSRWARVGLVVVAGMVGALGWPLARTWCAGWPDGVGLALRVRLVDWVAIDLLLGLAEQASHKTVDEPSHGNVRAYLP